MAPLSFKKVFENCFTTSHFYVYGGSKTSYTYFETAIRISFIIDLCNEKKQYKSLKAFHVSSKWDNKCDLQTPW